MAETIVNGLGDALDIFVKQLEKNLHLNTIEKESITREGGAVFRDDLRKVTNERHRSNHRDETYGHAADHITMYSPHGGDSKYGTLIGDTLVGWDNPFHAENMMHINDGTCWITADPFITNLRNDPTVRGEMYDKMAERYKAIMSDHENRGDD